MDNSHDSNKPVAWQYRDANDDGTWGAWLGCDKRLTESTWREVRPLYATPPAAQPAPVQQADREIQALTSLGGKLALELECLLLECNDTAATSKWWNSAHAALEDWRSYLWHVSHGDNHVSPLGKD